MRKDITDEIEAFVAVYMDNGEIFGIYGSRRVAERSIMREKNCKVIRLVPAERVLIDKEGK